MKINGPSSTPGNGGPERVDQRTANPKVQNEQAAQVHDQARLSVDQAKIHSLRKELDRVPDVRAERVASLKKVVQEGRYHVSNEQIAGAMFSELFGR
ncbi:MAG: flagellar biosynthesis anti-sigma factor FlgM [Acidobacteria bacterium]|nr:flagellar biosynthesis anti-sigma factor FlgM [Acidobacteriota bacterium]